MATNSPPSDAEATAPISISTFTPRVADPPTINVTPFTSEGKKRPRRSDRRGANAANIVTPISKKGLFLNEIGDSLVDHLYANSKLDDDLGLSCVSAIKSLRSNLTATLTGISCANFDNRSGCTLAGFDAAPLKIWRSCPYHNEIFTSPASIEADHPCSSGNSPRIPPGRRNHANVFSLDDLSEIREIERLIRVYGRVANGGILDRSYRFFVNETRTAALSFKVQNGVAIVGGDPLCEMTAIPDLLAEFALYRRRYRWGLAFMGVSESFARNYAQAHGWTTLRFGTERVLNPQTNEVLLERCGKRIVAQSKQLLHRCKGGITLGVYAPAIHGTNRQLETDLVAIYDSWRTDHNCAGTQQAFITIYDLFVLPALMIFVYTSGPDGCLNGFAALRRVGAAGYHVDPCIAAPGSPKGISDLLLVAAMAMLNRAGVSYLSFGFEPLHALSFGDIADAPFLTSRLIRGLYSHVFHRLPIGGTKAYHDKFRPDPSQDSGVYLVFPKGINCLHHLLAIVHMANINLRKMFLADVSGWVSNRRTKYLLAVSSDRRKKK
ncbi:hypothetical protein N7510_005144 [Penicillium lagena]|uniref:uncharacterized protein n=1 Tax=Penicillium lagena TaxID=94218 RepID=UPI00254147C2|nr:uncharacterized protein N7510_005144 [Penicillium lagena]KAJ5621160.1 hypothetical protein N7510_005144 [Penicillium lagena]